MENLKEFLIDKGVNNIGEIITGYFRIHCFCGDKDSLTKEAACRFHFDIWGYHWFEPTIFIILASTYLCILLASCFKSTSSIFGSGALTLSARLRVNRLAFLVAVFAGVLYFKYFFAPIIQYTAAMMYLGMDLVVFPSNCQGWSFVGPLFARCFSVAVLASMVVTIIGQIGGLVWRVNGKKDIWTITAPLYWWVLVFAVPYSKGVSFLVAMFLISSTLFLFQTEDKLLCWKDSKKTFALELSRGVLRSVVRLA